MSSETFRRWFISTALTFATGFALVLVTQIDDITVQSLQDGTLIGVIFAGLRAGLKLVLEAFLASSVARQSGWEHSDNQDGHFGGRGGRMIVAARR